MANTLKFGNGQWATKDESVLAYNDENNNFKPLPFDFERGSTATRINKEGLIETVGAKEPRIDYLDDVKGALKLEPSRTNLITQSQAFGNSYWTKSGASIEGDASTAGSELVTNGGLDTDLSGWNVGSKWTFDNGKVRLQSSTSIGSGFSQDNVFVIGKTYIISFDAFVVSGYAKLERNNGGLLIQISETKTYNYTWTADVTKLYFNRFSAISDLTLDNVSVKEVSGFASPSVDSPLDAFKLVEGTNTGIHLNLLTSNITVVNGSRYTNSVFAKKGERDWMLLTEGTSVTSGAYFNLATGVVGTISGNGSPEASIQDLGDGWYRCSLTYTVVSTSARIRVYTSVDGTTTSYTGDGTSGVYIYGAQLEQGSYPTSLINTQGTVQTRLADTCFQTLPSSVFNSYPFSMFAEIDVVDTSTGYAFSLFKLSSSSEYFTIEYFSNVWHITSRPNGSTQRITSTTTVTKGTHKLVGVYTDDNLKLFLNGSLIASGSNTQSFNSNVDSLLLGQLRIAGDTNSRNSVRQALLYNTEFTDQEAIELTSN